MKHNNKQPNGTTKKAFSVGMAVVLALLGIGGCTVYNNLNKEDETPVQEDTQNDLLLTEDFDINDEALVRQRATDIHNLLSEELKKQITIEDIMEIIYYYNNNYDALKAMHEKQGLSEKDQIFAVKGITNDLYALLGDNIADDVNYSVGNSASINEDSEIHAYMFVAGGEEKNELVDLALATKKQLDDISALATDNYTKNAESFYGYFENLKNGEYSNETKDLGLLDVKAKTPLFTNSLTEEQKDNLKINAFNDYTDARFKAYIKAVGLTDALAKLEIEAQEKGEINQNHTPLKEEYNRQDAEDAVTHPVVDNREEETKVVDNGGKPVETQKDPVKEGATEKEETTEEEFIVEIPEEGTSEEFIPGGQVVEEYTTTYNAATNSWVVESTTKEVYVDADAKKAEELAKTFK